MDGDDAVDGDHAGGAAHAVHRRRARGLSLTIADQHTRYLPTCRGLLSRKGVAVRPYFERAFRQYGLPRPFAPTTGCPSPPPGFTGSRSSMCGGCVSGFSISGFTPAGRSRMARMNACIARSSGPPFVHTRGCQCNRGEQTGRAWQRVRGAVGSSHAHDRRERSDLPRLLAPEILDPS